LVRRGHDVTLFASGDSKTSAKLVSVYPKAVNYEAIQQMLSPLARNLQWMNSFPVFYHAVKAFEQAGEFDIIHDQTNYVGLFFARLIKTPVVSTYHGSFRNAEESPIEKQLLEAYKDHNWIAISDSQRKQTSIPLHFAGVVHHGIHVEKFPFSEKPGEYLVWLGRITPRKGIKEAIMAAKMAKERLVIAGVVKERDAEYFRTEIEPLIDGKQIVFIGPVDHEKKVEVLQHAKALLYPISWEEPFGIVMLEAMACGTPVIAFRRGAVPEVIVHGETGFIVETEKQMVKAIQDIEKIRRITCRQHVATHFTVGKMTDSYEELYRNVLKRRV
jgi:glycosyltransferase involved in cell wall biosynthesis